LAIPLSKLSNLQDLSKVSKAKLLCSKLLIKFCHRFLTSGIFGAFGGATKSIAVSVTFKSVAVSLF
jgi:hypothetical protein